MDPSSPSFGTKDGSCGYGAISKDRFPYFSTAALAPSNRFYTADALHGCGQCFQVQCADGRDGEGGWVGRGWEWLGWLIGAAGG